MFSPSAWAVTTVPSLLELSADALSPDDARLWYEKCSRDPSSSCHAANFAVKLPMAVADVFVKLVCKHLRNENASADLVAENLRPFLDGKRQPLGRLDLSGLNISHRTLALLLAAQQSTLTSLDLSDIGLTSLDINSEEVCSILTDFKVKCLKLNSLKVTSCDLLRIPRFRVQERHESKALPTFGQDDFDLGNDWDQEIPIANKLAYDAQKLSSVQETNLKLTRSLPHFLEFCPNIEHLYLLQGLLNNIKDETADEFLLRIFKTLEGLRTLDLSEWNFPNHLLVLEKVSKLTTLILYDVQNLESCIPMISGLKNLRCLDLSQSEHTTGHYLKPVTCLHTLVIDLPNLECLDISGTNLTSDISDDDRPREMEIEFVSSYIAGLSFLIRRLKYLGIFNCDPNRWKSKYIPAEKICCDYSENQIILALEAYMSRPRMIEAVLDESYELYSYEFDSSKRHVDALHLILQVLSSHRTNVRLQVAGYTAMFYILPKVKMNKDTKRAVLGGLLYAMENHTDEQEIMRKCFLLLYVFEMPQDFLLNYIQIAKQLGRVLIANGVNLDTQLFVLQILNSMALRLDQSQKILLGPTGIIKTILALIRRKLAAGTCDIVMEKCWAVLCHVTDETPSNCKRFLEADGMQLFSLCFLRFRSSSGLSVSFTVPDINIVLVLNMFILVGNVAEVKCLRSQLMDKDLWSQTIFWAFLFLHPKFAKGFEITYRNTYILAHLFGEGEAAWYNANVGRRAVMEKMVEVIGKWDLSTKIWFQYRSLKPILQLLTMIDSHASQHWAVWALANLTSTDPEKYCRYVDEEGGEKLVRKLVYDTRVSARISILARVVLANMDTWRNPGAIIASNILNEAIIPAKQNSNPYLKKVSRIMMRFLPIWLPVSTLVIASLYIGSYERAIHPSSRAIRPAS
ncbi:zyg eleven-related protein 1 [Ditylenchus destructor]|nr:zyg eleven-related protein 1 [Ditylenchus destructor]